MAQRRLNELLKEDQEPFLLKNYISDRRTQLRQSSTTTSFETQLMNQVKKRKPISETPNFHGKFGKNSCFLPFQDSPELRRLASPVSKSPQNAIFLHIPARTTALLLEAAQRIQKQSSPSPATKPRKVKNRGFGLFDSILKRLASRNRSGKREIEADRKEKLSVKDILRWDSSVSKISDQRRQNSRPAAERKSCRFSCNGSSSPSSAVWSETKEDNSPEIETSSSCSSSQSEIFVSENRDIIGVCESPFRFALQRSPPSGDRTPDFPSPAASPRRDKTEGTEILKKLENGGEEEEKEQCSPVSVLDPPFEDDEDANEDYEDRFDIEGSYAIVQRTKLQLLQKLRRFEKLAELDPIELHKRMLQNFDDDEDEDQESHENDDSASSDHETIIAGYVTNNLDATLLRQNLQVPKFMKRLVSDLVSEEEKSQQQMTSSSDGDVEVTNRVLKRLESWKEVESNTIDMMVEQDFKREYGLWERNGEEVEVMAKEIEVVIFGLLVEELWN